MNSSAELSVMQESPCSTVQGKLKIEVQKQQCMKMPNRTVIRLTAMVTVRFGQKTPENQTEHRKIENPEKIAGESVQPGPVDCD